MADYEVKMNFKCNGKNYKIGDTVSSKDIGKAEKRLVDIGVLKEVKKKAAAKKAPKKEIKKEAK